jgi:sigma-B regulation protein RsbU (phosphoserine phosphatase)
MSDGLLQTSPELVEPFMSPGRVPAGDAFILVVDDDKDNREPLRHILERKGYRVDTAADGPSALKRLAEDSFDLVLLDRMMPGMSGLEVLSELRRLYPPTLLPVIMATASDQSKDIVDALATGANDYVTKPLDFSVVLARINTQLSLKRSVEQVVELERRLSQRNAELETANHNLSQAAEQTRRELEAAAKVQEAFLPAVAPQVQGVKFAWAFRPCRELAGDSLNVFAFDRENVGFYVLDVSGHGVAASLLAVAATRVLSLTKDDDSILIDRRDDGHTAPAAPAHVANALSLKLPWNDGAAQFLTMFYVVLNARTGRIDYVSAGHPAAIRVARNGPPELLHGTGVPIGIGDRYEQQSAKLSRGDRLYLYSDGVTETMNPAHELFGTPRLEQALKRNASASLGDSISLLLQELDRWRHEAPARDDVCIVAVQLE